MKYRLYENPPGHHGKLTPKFHWMHVWRITALVIWSPLQQIHKTSFARCWSTTQQFKHRTDCARSQAWE